MENITKEQADVIGEIANICTGNAATTLSMILNKPTNITTPRVDVLAGEEALSNDDHVLVKVPYTKGLDGTNLLVLKNTDALIIANLMMGGDGTGITETRMDELTISAISEAMNQMCGTIATSMATSPPPITITFLPTYKLFFILAALAPTNPIRPAV